MIELLQRLRDRFRRHELDDQLDAEMQVHLELLVQEERERGADEGEARRIARLRFGNLSRIAETSRERWGFAWFEELRQDLSYAARGLARAPVFTLATTVTLAVGVGATSAVYLLMQRTVMAELPVSDPERLVRIDSDRGADGINQNLSYPLFAMIRNQARSFEGVVAHVPVEVALRSGEGSIRSHAGAISAGFFSTMGAPLIMGRELTTDDERPGGAALAVLSHALWKRMGASTDVIGSAMSINGTPFTVVGVVAEGFHGPIAARREEVWIALGAMERIGLSHGNWENAGSSWLFVFARLREGIMEGHGQAELTALDGRARAASIRNAGESSRLLDGSQGLTWLTAPVAQPLRLLLFATLSVLLIVCANIAGLLLSRADARRKEFGIRLALGASRSRLLRQLFTESLVLATIGGAFALLVVRLGIRLLGSYELPFSGPLAIDTSLDSSAIAITLAIAVATTIVFGLVPAMRASRPNVLPSLKGSERVGRIRLFGLRGLLVVAQVAMSLTLATGATLLLRSLQNLQDIDVGYGAQNALLAAVDLEQGGYTRENGLVALTAILARVEAIHGVQRATAASIIHPVPYGSSWDGIRLDGYTESATRPVGFDVDRVAPGYFETLDVPVIAGRMFGSADVWGTPNVAIVNETFVAKYMQGRNPIGVHFYHGPEAAARRFEIVGVVRDGKYRGLREREQASVFLPLLQHYSPSVTLAVAATGNPMALAPQLRQAVAAVNPSLPVFDIKSLKQHVAAASSSERMVASLSAAFGVIALVLAAVGLFGLIAYSVATQTRDIGVRMALGATSASVVRLMVARGALLVAFGTVLGLLGVWYIGRFNAGFLFGVSSTDARSMAVATLVLLATGLVAAWLPARRAAFVDPVVALRTE